MKKILALSIATLSIVTLAACSGQKSDSDMKKKSDSSSEMKDDMKKDEMKSSDSEMKNEKSESSDMKSDKE